MLVRPDALRSRRGSAMAGAAQVRALLEDALEAPSSSAGLSVERAAELIEAIRIGRDVR